MKTKDYYLVQTDKHFYFGVLANNLQQARATAMKVIEEVYDNQYKIYDVKILEIWHCNLFLRKEK